MLYPIEAFLGEGSFGVLNESRKLQVSDRFSTWQPVVNEWKEP